MGIRSRKNMKLLALITSLTILSSSIHVATIVRAEVTASVNPIEWTFEDSTKTLDGWTDGGAWDYKGKTILSYDSKTVGNGSLKLTLDYTNDSEVSWSEAKISNNFKTPVNFNGYSVLNFDFIYNPKSMTKGAFQTKLWINNAVDAYNVIDLSGAVDIGNGLKKVKATVKFTPKDVSIDGITLSIIGSKTDYKGDIYLDNITISQEKVADIYVDKTAVPNPNKTKVQPSMLQVPNQVTLVDSKVTTKTADLYAYLQGIGKSKYVLYGHQNDTHHKAFLKDSGTNSDTKDITGSIAAVCGIDALSLTGAELALKDGDKRDLVTAAADISSEAASEGGIVTLSAHMPNFAEVVKKGKVNGKYDYSGYSPNVTTGDVVSRIMPGGDLNDAFKGYLDIIANYGKQLEAKNVPVLFRPFHENNGSWFWWGKAFCDENAYKNLYRYTVEYLRDVKGVHNFLYIYSPNGPFADEADYLSRYPGDNYVDVVAFDMYHDNPTTNDNWINSFKETISLVDGIAKKHNKLSTISETGMRVMQSLNDGLNHSGLATKGNVRKDWFEEIVNAVTDSNMAYFMTWANFDSYPNFFAPFMVSNSRGHEMINNFINFYNDDKAVFANGVGDYSKINVTNVQQGAYGYITSPTSGSRVLSSTKITASVKNATSADKVNFVLKNNKGEKVMTLPAILVNGQYTADITKAALDKIGATMGSIDLYIGSNFQNSINVKFNIPEVKTDPAVVDNFDNYYGEDALLQNVWTTNAGAGCSVTPKLTSDNSKFYKGQAGLEFNYKISTEKSSEGWAGITKTIEADWSKFDALQFWCTPDGNAQKLVIQITSNGEDFEVFLPEFAGTTKPQLITLPFSQFKGKNNGTFDPSKIQRVGIWCNTIVPTGHTGAWTVDSKMYFDDIKAINTKAVTEPTKVTLSNSTLDLTVGDSKIISATVDPAEASQEVIWTSSDAKVATVDSNGKITAVAAGNVVIIATTKNGVAAQCTVNVKAKVQPSKTQSAVANNQTQTSKTSTLPKTGGVDPACILSFGALISLVGVGMIRKKK